MTRIKKKLFSAFYFVQQTTSVKILCKVLTKSSIKQKDYRKVPISKALGKSFTLLTYKVCFW